jgi:hypothetical protein
MVWRESMPDWKAAGEVNELFKSELFQTANAPRPPPLATAKATPSRAWLETLHQNKSPVSNDSYALAHWQGRLGLATSFWLNCILVGIVFPIMAFVLISAASSIVPEAATLLVLALIIVHIALIVWQSVGLYRCGLANIFSPEPRFKLWAHLSVIWAAQSFVFVPLVLVAIIGGITALGASTAATFDEVAAEIEAGQY